MKVRVKIGDLVEQITQAAITADQKAQDTPLGKVYMRTTNRQVKDSSETEPYLYLFSSDMHRKTFIKLKVDEVIEEGKTLIDTRKLLGALIGRDPTLMAEVGVLENSTGASRVRIKVGRNVAHIPFDNSVTAHDTMIKSLPRAESCVAKIKASVLLDFIRKSWFCMLKEDNAQQKYAMSVLNLRGEDGEYIAQAIDGRILARHSSKQDAATTFNLPRVLIPSTALEPLQKLLGRSKDLLVDILEGPKDPKGNLQEIFLQIGDILFGTVLRTGGSPDLTMVLTEHKPAFEIKIKKDELKQTLDRAVNFVENQEDKRLIKITAFDAKTVIVEAGDEQLTRELKDELESEVVSGPFKGCTVSLSVDYLAHVVAVSNGDHVTIGLNGQKNKAVVINDVSETMSCCFAIMPVSPSKVKAAPKAAPKTEEPQEEAASE